MQLATCNSQFASSSSSSSATLSFAYLSTNAVIFQQQQKHKYFLDLFLSPSLRLSLSLSLCFAHHVEGVDGCCCCAINPCSRFNCTLIYKHTYVCICHPEIATFMIVAVIFYITNVFHVRMNVSSLRHCLRWLDELASALAESRD